MKGKIYRNKALDLENMTLESPLGTQFQLKKTLSNSNILTSNYPINNNLEREALL